MGIVMRYMRLTLDIHCDIEHIKLFATSIMLNFAKEEKPMDLDSGVQLNISRGSQDV